jgi:hypothetical protein
MVENILQLQHKKGLIFLHILISINEKRKKIPQFVTMYPIDKHIGTQLM